MAQRDGNVLTTLVREHIALLVPLIGVLIFTIRCTVVSRGDPAIAATLFAETSLADAIRAVIGSLTVFLLELAFIAIPWAAGRWVRKGNWWSMSLTAVLLLISWAAYVATLYFIGILGQESLAERILLILVGLCIVFVIANWSYQIRNEGSRSWGGVFIFGPFDRQLINAVGGALILLILLTAGLYSLGNPDFWLPAERFAFKGRPAFTGYLLKGSEDYLIIFEERRRIVIEEPKTDLVDRQFCSKWSSDKASARIQRMARYLPRCP